MARRSRDAAAVIELARAGLPCSRRARGPWRPRCARARPRGGDRRRAGGSCPRRRPGNGRTRSASDSCLVWPVQGQDEAADARSRGFQNLPLCCQLARHFCETALRDVLVRRTRVWCLCFIRVFYTRRRRRRSVRPPSLGLVPVPLPALPVLVLVHLLHALELDRGLPRTPRFRGSRTPGRTPGPRARRRPDGGARRKRPRRRRPATLNFEPRTERSPSRPPARSHGSPRPARPATRPRPRRKSRRRTPGNPRARRRRSAQTRLQLAHGQAPRGRGIDAPGLERRAASRPPRRGGRRARVGETRARARRNRARALGSVASRDAGRPRRVAELVSPEGPAPRAIARGGRDRTSAGAEASAAIGAAIARVTRSRATCLAREASIVPV